MFGGPEGRECSELGASTPSKLGSGCSALAPGGQAAMGSMLLVLKF